MIVAAAALLVAMIITAMIMAMAMAVTVIVSHLSNYWWLEVLLLGLCRRGNVDAVVVGEVGGSPCIDIDIDIPLDFGFFGY
jgi:hypothetical protein